MESASGELQDLRARVEKLERRSKKWRLWTLVALLFLVAANEFYLIRSLGYGVRYLSARNLVIKDDRGRNRIIMNAVAGGPGLLFLGPDGKVRASLSARDDNAYFNLYGSKGNDEINLGMNADTAVFFAMNGWRGEKHSYFLVALRDSGIVKLKRGVDSVAFRVP